MIVFNHTGSSGDVLFSLLFATEFSELLNQEFSYNLQLYQETKYLEPHPNGSFGLTDAAADFLIPLLKTVCKEVTTSLDEPQESFNLSAFRRLRLNLAAGDIRLWYYALVGCILPMDLQRQILRVDSSDVAKDRVIIAKTCRYNNFFFNWKDLEEFKDSFLFVGLDDEHKAFCKDFFNVERLEVKDALDVAKAMSGAKMTVGNPSGIFTIAEMLKVPRCLATPELMKIGEHSGLCFGPVNVIPQGGKAVMAPNSFKMKAALKEVLG